MQAVIGRLIVYLFVFGFWAMTFVFTIYVLGRIDGRGVSNGP